MKVLQPQPDGSYVSVEVPNEQLADHFLAGNIAFQHPDQEIPVKLPDGRVGSIKASGAEDAFKNGVVPVGDDEYRKAYLENKYGGFGEGIKAGAAGLARGLTLDASDWALTRGAQALKGREYAEQVKKGLAERKEARPIISAVSEGVGAIAPAFVTGGESAIAEAPELAEAAKGLSGAAKAAREGLPGILEEARAPQVKAIEGLADTAKQAGIQPEIVDTVKEAIQPPPVHPLEGGVPHPAGGPLPQAAAETFGVETPTLDQAAEHAAARVADQPSMFKTAIANSPAGLLSRAGNAADRLANGTIEELFGPEVANSATGRILSGAVRAGASGAIEGGLFQLGNEVSEESLGDHELNAQKLLAAFGHGAFYGAAFGAGLAGAGGVAKEAGIAVLSKLAPSITKLKGIQAYRAFSAGGGRAAGSTKEALRMFEKEAEKLGLTGPELLGNFAVDKGLMEGAPGAQELFERTREMRLATGEELGNLVGQFDGLAGRRSDLPSFQEFSDRLFGLNGHEKNELMDTLKRFSETSGHIAGLSDEEMARLASMPKLQATLKARFDEAAAEATRLENIARRATGDEVEAARKAEREAKYISVNAHKDMIDAFREAKALRAKDEGSYVRRVMNDVKKYFGEDGRALFKDIRDARIHIQDLVKKWTPDPYSGLGNLHQEILKQIRGHLEDTIVAAADKVSSKASSNVIKEYLATKGDYGKLKFLEKKAEASLAAHMNNQHVSLTGKMFGVAEFLHAAASGNPVMAAAKGVALAAMHKMVRDRGTAASALILDKLSQYAAIQKAGARVDKTMQQGVNGLFARMAGKTVKRVSRAGQLAGRKARATGDVTMPGTSRADNEARIDKVAELASAPSIKAEHAAAALGGQVTHAPKTMSALASAANVTTQFLVSKMPKGGIDYSEITGPKFGRSSDAELTKFANYHEGADDFPATMHKLATGRLTQEHVEALRTSKPKVFDELHKRILEGLNNMKSSDRERMPFHSQMELSMILGAPVTWAQTPAGTKVLQQNDVQITQSDGRPTQPQSAGRQAPSRIKHDFSKDIQTEIDSLENHTVGDHPAH